MRQITVTAPQGHAHEIAAIAFAVGISDVTIGEKRILSATRSKVVKDSIEMKVGTSLAKAFIWFLTNPPVRYAEFNPLETSLLISCAVGVAAGLATVDDAGRREMIGLAATAQIAIIPAWIGLCLILGFPSSETAPAKHRFIALVSNVGAMVIASFITYTLLGVKASALKCFNEPSAKQQHIALA
jgi:hypothetical protein